jgi:PAS domain S-box-containing protein
MRSFELQDQVSGIKPGGHLCLFYDQDPGEQIPALIPFLRSGLALNEQCLYIADDQTTDQLSGRLEEGGIDVRSECDSGRLRLYTRNHWRQAGELDSNKKAQQLRQFVAQAARSGFKGIRFAVEMTWTLGPDIDVWKLEHWEATINTLFDSSFPGRIICQYNRSRLRPEALIAALHTHPEAILGCTVYPNPFFEAPFILNGDGNGHGHHSGAGHAHSVIGNGQAARARLDWMIAQLQRAREAERNRIEADALRAIISNFPEGLKLVDHLAVARDVSAQKATEDAWRILAAVVESSDDAIITKDLQGTITSWNPGAERLFGYRAEEVIGKPISILIPEERLDEEPSILARLRRGERIDHYETVRRRKDGTLVQISLTVSPVIGEDGRIIGASKIARNITEQKAAEQALRASEERFRTLADNISQLAWTADELGWASWYNRRWYEYTGTSFEDMKGFGWEKVHHPDHVERVKENLNTTSKRGEEWEDTFPLRGKDGSYRWFLTRAVPIRDAHGKIKCWFGTNTDITELRRAREELARSHEDLERAVQERTASLREVIAQMEEFSYSVSHDLRAPVRAMKGYAQVTLDEYGEHLDARGRDFLDRIIRGSSRMERLIHDVLTYSRLARCEIQLQPVSLARLLRDLIQQYPEIQSPNAEITLREPLQDVLAHEPSLMQALSNLLTNGVKFVARGTTPRLQVWTEIRGPKVRLWIEDNGIGIKPEYQRRLFGLFERVNQDPRFDGTGIGLAIVRKAAERMGGSVGVESDGITGSSFWIELAGANPP